MRGPRRPESAVSTRFAERIAAFRFRDLPPGVVAQAKLIVLDTLGAMLAASAPKYPAGRLVMEFVHRLGGAPESSLVGQGSRSSCVNAALGNATLAYACDLEPHHPGAILHAPAVIVPTSLAVGEMAGADGARCLAAVVLGIEVACRVSYALDPVALYDRGFHPSAICGAFGAAAAAGHLFRLTPQRQAVALGLAMQQASGLLAWAADPTEHSRPLNPGLAARNGTTAAYLARLGFGGPPAPFDGRYDAFTAFSGHANPGALLADWGRRFHLSGVAYKRYASCAFTHPGLDALLGLAADERLGAADIQRIVLRFPKSGAHMIDDHPLRSHCAQYVLPVGLVFGRVGFDDIVVDRSRHPEVARLRAGLSLVHDPDLDAGYPARYTSVVEILTGDGRRLSRRVESAKGTPANPFTPEEIRAKFRRLTAALVPPARAAALLAEVDGLDRAPGLMRLAVLLRARVGAGSRR
ncbi:MAG TPA: MmgE/PrpD family protein [Methylomirabilota bacterium]|jgi:2-methylcitrate dehydratase PrpD|nr:MmgE/PrpD family protein [Methylomirabilota bacterium]